MKSEFGILRDGKKHTVTVLVDGFRLFQIENPTIAVTVDQTEAVRHILPGAVVYEVTPETLVTRIEIEGQIDPTTEITFGGD